MVANREKRAENIDARVGIDSREGALTRGFAVSLNGNVATVKAEFTVPGNYGITASYPGDSNNKNSWATLTQTILGLTTTTLVSSLSPSLSEKPVTFTATVRSKFGAIPDGESVTFYSGASLIGAAATVGGVASVTASSLTAGRYTIKAVYAGDATFKASSYAISQVVNGYPTSSSLTSNPNPSVYDQAITLTAGVTGTGPFAPTGNVSFVSSGNILANVKLNSSGLAVVTTRKLNAGSYPLTAVYKGDPYNQSSTSRVQNQTVLQTTSQATITSSLNPSIVGQAVTFTATITSPTVMPTGPVTFIAGSTSLGSVQLSGGKATFTTSSLPAGSTVVKVKYDGNSNIKGSSASLTQVLQP
jgi:hypothetical protein